jgi:hypothetical protein
MTAQSKLLDQGEQIGGRGLTGRLFDLTRVAAMQRARLLGQTAEQLTQRHRREGAPAPAVLVLFGKLTGRQHGFLFVGGHDCLRRT